MKIQINSKPQDKWFYRIIFIFLILYGLWFVPQCYAQDTTDNDILVEHMMLAVDQYVADLNTDHTDFGCQWAEKKLRERINFLLSIYEFKTFSNNGREIKK